MKPARNPSTANPPTIETERLTLRALSAEDLPAAHRIFNDADVRRHLFDDTPVSVGMAASLLARSADDFAAGGVGLFGIRARGEEDLIGFCGFFVVEDSRGPELVYGLVPSCWGRGFATEAALAVARHALEKGSLRRVLVAADEPNVASLRVIEKLGAGPLGENAPGPPGVRYFEIAPGRPPRSEQT